MGILAKSYGNAIVLAAAARRRGIVYSTPEMRRRMRDRRVRWLVKYAARTVPWYRDFFREQRLDPRDIRKAEDLAGLPILEKSQVSADPERFRSQSHHGRRALAFKTSGSTGLPLNIYHDRRSILENIANSEPERAVRNAYLEGVTGCRVLRINRSSSTLSAVQDFCARNTLIPGRPQAHRIDVEQKPQDVIARIRELKPHVLAGYGAYLEMFFRYVHEQDIDFPMPRLVTYGAEGMTLPGRDLITKVFGLPVVAAYNAVECFKIGFQCGHGPSYHLHDDLCHVRVVDPFGHDVPRGQTGSVVITNLVNRGTVLLNYRLGDVAALSASACSCGRTLEMLTGLEGRTLDAIILPDGSFVHAGAVWTILSQGEGVVRYQLIQHQIDRFELRLVTVDEAAFARFKEQVVPRLQNLFGPSALIDVGRQKQLQTESSGKFRPIMSKCGLRTPRLMRECDILD